MKGLVYDMILRCDKCLRFYESDMDCHEIGEPNLCCDACAWKMSHDSDEPQPEHTCDQRFDRDVKSLFLFLETCLVDNYGRVDSRHMNATDIQIARDLVKSNYLEFGRLLFKVIDSSAGDSHRPTHWVRFTHEAWRIAHYLRRQRSNRMLAKHKEKLDAEMTKNK